MQEIDQGVIVEEEEQKDRREVTCGMGQILRRGGVDEDETKELKRNTDMLFLILY